MALDEDVDGVAVAHGVDDRARGIAERHAAPGPREGGREALIGCPRARVGAPAEKKEYFDNKTS